MVIIRQESCEGQAQDGGVGVISAAKLISVHIFFRGVNDYKA